MSTAPKTTGSKATGLIVAINLKLLGVAGFGFAAWAIWPTSMRGYGFGVLSALMAAAAFGSLVAAIKAIGRLYERDKTLYAFEQLGGRPKGARLATSEVLKRARMTDE